MKMIYLVLFLFCSNLLFAQKTEDAKKNLDDDKKEEQKKDTSSHSTKNSSSAASYSSPSESSLASAILWPIAEWTCVGVTHIAFNIPFGDDLQLQPVRYARYPFESGNHIGLRTETGQELRLEMALAYGQNFNDNFSDLGLRAALHYRGWALRGRFKYVNEEISKYTINYYSAAIERKSKAFEFMDMGISGGYGLMNISDGRYDGFLLGFNLELFIIKPISFFYKPDVLFYKDKTITTTTFGGNVHFTNYYVGLSYEKFKIAGEPFNNFRILLGLYI